MPEATLTSKGQITLPKEIREALSLHTGDRVSFILEESGQVRQARIMPSILPVQELKGILKPARKKPVSLEEMSRAIKKHGSAL